MGSDDGDGFFAWSCFSLFLDGRVDWRRSDRLVFVFLCVLRGCELVTDVPGKIVHFVVWLFYVLFDFVLFLILCSCSLLRILFWRFWHHFQELAALRLRYDGDHKRLALVERDLKQERGGPLLIVLASSPANPRDVFYAHARRLQQL